MGFHAQLARQRVQRFTYELLAREGPPAYARKPMPSLLDGFRDEVRAMLAERRHGRR